MSFFLLNTAPYIIYLLFSCYGSGEPKNSDGHKSINEHSTFSGNDTLEIIPVEIIGLEIPNTAPEDTVIYHTAYALLYNEKHEQASWVAYHLTKEETVGLFKRTDRFIPDPLVKTGSAIQKDYQGKGYDRGHLAPAADMGWSKITMAESFYFSNMSPQNGSFNRGIWKNLEGLVRDWAIEDSSLYIVTGPVLTDGLKTIGINEVSVPDYYYKVILDYTLPEVKSIAFILPNEASDQPLTNYIASIDSVEKFTGIDFFPLLPDDQENYLERTLCDTCWTWKTTTTKSQKDKKKEVVSVQCKAKLKNGKRCKNKTKSPNKKCKIHGGN